MLPTDNPFAAPSELPLQFPPFDRIREEHYRPGVRAGDGRAAAPRSRRSPPTRPRRRSRTPSRRSNAPAGLLDRVLRCSSTSSPPTPPTPSARSRPRCRRGWPRTRTRSTSTAALFARIDALHRRRAELGLDARAAAAARALPPRLRPGRRRVWPSRTRSGCARSTSELSSLTTDFGTRLLAETSDLAVHVADRRRARRPRRRRRRRRGAARRAPAASTATCSRWCCRPSQPALAVADRPRRCGERLHEASVSRGPARRRARHPRDAPRDRRPARRAGRACSASPTTRRTSSTTGPPAPSRRSTRCSARSSRRPSPTPAPRRRRSRRAARDGHDGPLSPGTGRSTPSGCAGDASTSTPHACGPTSSCERVLHDGVFHAADAALRADASPSATTCPSTTPTCRVFEVCDDDGSRSACSSSTSTPATTKRGGAWMNDLRRPVAPARHAAGRASTTSTSPSPPTASRRC